MSPRTRQVLSNITGFYALVFFSIVLFAKTRVFVLSKTGGDLPAAHCPLRPGPGLGIIRQLLPH